jgi:hypothetical protein
MHPFVPREIQVMPIQSPGRAPYAPGQTVLDVITTYRERGLQTPIDKEVLLRAGVSESLALRTLQALQLLDLIDERGQPLEVMEGLRIAPSDEFPDRLADVVRAAYEEVFNYVDPGTAPANKVEDAFRTYTPAGQRSRMVTLFISLCEAANIISEEARSRLSSGRQATPSRRSSKSSNGGSSPTGARPSGRAAGGGRGSSGSGRGRGVEVGAEPGIASLSLPAPVAGLLSQLPDAVTGWTEDRRDKFLHTLRAVLDFCIPVVEPDAEGEEGEA